MTDLATLTWLDRDANGKRRATLVIGDRGFDVTEWTHHEAEGFTTFRITAGADQWLWQWLNGELEKARAS